MNAIELTGQIGPIAINGEGVTSVEPFAGHGYGATIRLGNVYIYVKESYDTVLGMLDPTRVEPPADDEPVEWPEPPVEADNVVETDPVGTPVE